MPPRRVLALMEIILIERTNQQPFNHPNYRVDECADERYLGETLYFTFFGRIVSP
jgi:hypothetical protein